MTTKAKTKRVLTDTQRIDWLTKHTKFSFNFYDEASGKFGADNCAQGVVLRYVIDCAIEHNTPDEALGLAGRRVSKAKP